MTSTRSFLSHFDRWMIFLLVSLLSSFIFASEMVRAAVSPVILTITGVSNSCANSHQFNWSDLPNSLSPHQTKKDLSPGFHYKVVNRCGGQESLFLQRGTGQMAGFVWYSLATTNAENLLADDFELSDGSSAYLYIPADAQILNSPFGNFLELVLRDSIPFLPFATKFTVGNSIPPDVTPPEIIKVQSPSDNGSYRAGQEIAVEVHFSEPVLVSSVAGSPTIKMETGEVDNSALYSSGSGTTVLNFVYQVRPGDYSLDFDYLSPSSFLLNGSSIVDSSGNAAITSMPEPGSLNSVSPSRQIVLDTESPSISISRVNTVTLRSNEVDSVGFVISESVNQFDQNSIEIVDGVLHNFEGSQRHYSVQVSALRDTEGTIRVSIPENIFTDEAGNGNIASDFLLIPFNTLSSKVEVVPVADSREEPVINTPVAPASTDIKVAQPILEVQDNVSSPSILQLKTLPATGVVLNGTLLATFVLFTGGTLLTLASRRRRYVTKN